VQGKSHRWHDHNYLSGAGFTIFRIVQGSYSQTLEDIRHEQYLVIEGELSAHDHQVCLVGEPVLLTLRTEHFSASRAGDTFAVSIQELEWNRPFTSVGLLMSEI
jgi:hypothetical protein